MANALANASQVQVLVGRISNLFGTRQNIAKPQGFVSHLFSAMSMQRPLVFTVPGSTIRDFVFADDIGERVAGWARTRDLAPGLRTKILASERSVTLAHLTTIASRVARRSPRVLFSLGAGTEQPRVIRFRSTETVSAELDRIPSRSLEHGLWLTWSELMRRRVSPG
jgi:nucleoside-diphosphate-sugar epimerase